MRTKEHHRSEMSGEASPCNTQTHTHVYIEGLAHLRTIHTHPTHTFSQHRQLGHDQLLPGHGASCIKEKSVDSPRGPVVAPATCLKDTIQLSLPTPARPGSGPNPCELPLNAAAFPVSDQRSPQKNPGDGTKQNQNRKAWLRRTLRA